MPSRSVNFRGFPPSVDAVRESLQRLEDLCQREYKATTASLFPNSYSAPSEVPDAEPVFAITLASVMHEDGKESFSSMRALLAHLDTTDYVSAFATASVPIPGAFDYGFTLDMRPDGYLEVKVEDADELGHVLAPVQVEVRKAVAESDARTQALLEASFPTTGDAQDVNVAPRRRLRPWVITTLKWFGSVATALLIAYLVFRLGWN